MLLLSLIDRVYDLMFLLPLVGERVTALERDLVLFICVMNRNGTVGK